MGSGKQLVCKEQSKYFNCIWIESTGLKLAWLMVQSLLELKFKETEKVCIHMGELVLC